MTIPTHNSGARRLESTGRRIASPREERMTNVTEADAFTRVPPQDLEAEQAAAGAMLLSPAAITDVRSVLTRADFYRPAHADVFDAACGLADRGEPVDPITLTTELERLGVLQRVGGPGYLHTLVNAVPTAANAEYYADRVRRCAVRRHAIEEHTRAIQDLYDGEGDLEEMCDRHEAAIHAAHRDARTRTPYQRLAEIIEMTIDDQEHPDTRQGVLTGFQDVDQLTHGFQPGELVVVAARPAMGKSTLAMDFLRTMAIQQNIPTALFSLEMGALEIGQRVLSAEARVGLHHIRGYSLTPEDEDRIARRVPELLNAPMFIDTSPNLTMAEIATRAREMHSREGLSLLAVDYLQLLESGSRRRGNRQEEVSEISRRLKLLAKELNIPVIALSQLNRGPESREDKKPMVSDLRESGAVEQDADMVILLHRPDAYDKESPRAGEADLIFGKCRNAPTCTITVCFQGHYSRFTDMASTPGGAGDYRNTLPKRETPAKAHLALVPDPRPATPPVPPSGPQAGVQAASRTPEDRPAPAEPARVQGSGTERVNGQPVTGHQLLTAEAGEHQEHDDVRETDAVQPAADDVPAPRLAPTGTAGAEAERPETAYEERDDERGFPALSHLKQGIKRSRLHPVPVIRKAERDGEPWSLMIQQMDCSPKWLAPGWGSRMVRYEEDGKRRRRRELIVPEDAGAGTLVVIDRNGSFPSACSSVTVAANVLHHTGALATREITDSNGKPCKLGGIFYAEVPAWERTDMPHPWGRITDYADANGAVWVPTPVIELTEKLAKDGHLAAPVIRDSWAGRSTQGLFKPLYEEARKAREEFIKAGNLKDPAYAEYKLRASTAVRLLWPKEVSSPFWRPDWYLSVVAESSVRHWAQAFRAVQAGHHLVALQKTDEAAFWTPDGAVPDTYRVGDMFGEIKTKGGLS